MGLGLSFAEGEGPRFARPLRDEADIARLAVPDLERLRYVFDAVASIRRTLAGRVPLIGFAGSPWTLACYMIEGGASDDYRLAKTLLYARPELLQRILDVNADAVGGYLDAQVEAGAQAVMLFDSWGGVLAEGAFRRFGLTSIARTLARVRREHDGRRVPRIVFTKGGGPWLEAIAALPVDVVGLDWTIDLAEARRRVGPGRAIQGNLDPCVLFAPARRIREEVAMTLQRAAAEGCADGHVFNLGHGISQHTPPEHVTELVEAVHAESRRVRVPAGREIGHAASGVASARE
jgi:uroporphyrinogen decarboxylase